MELKRYMPVNCQYGAEMMEHGTGDWCEADKAIELVKAEAKLVSAIDNAMKRLPEGRAIRLHLSRGEHSVSVTARNGRRVWFVFSDGKLAEAITCAVEWLENEG